MLCYFNKIYPVKDAFDGTLEPVFDVCFCNWIGKRDWYRIIDEIERDLNSVSNGKRGLFMDFLAWVKRALKHTSVIIVEGICEYAFVLSLGALGTEGRIGIYSREQ